MAKYLQSDHLFLERYRMMNWKELGLNSEPERGGKKKEFNKMLSIHCSLLKHEKY